MVAGRMQYWTFPLLLGVGYLLLNHPKLLMALAVLYGILIVRRIFQSVGDAASAVGIWYSVPQSSGRNSARPTWSRNEYGLAANV